jgi:hypothetical protein
MISKRVYIFIMNDWTFIKDLKPHGRRATKTVAIMSNFSTFELKGRVV